MRLVMLPIKLFIKELSRLGLQSHKKCEHEDYKEA